MAPLSTYEGTLNCVAVSTGLGVTLNQRNIGTMGGCVYL
jgi:hypothetical protein